MSNPTTTPVHEHFHNHDRLIKLWFERYQLPVTEVYYDFDRELLGWRHRGDNGKLTLRIEEDVLSDMPPEVLVQFFDSVNLLEILRRNPGAYTVVEQLGEHTVVRPYQKREDYQG